MIIAAEEVGFILMKVALEDASADLFGEADNETEIMSRSEMIILSFFGGVAGAPESTKTSASPAGVASRAVAVGVKRGSGIGQLSEIDSAVFGINFAMTSFASRSDAVKCVGAHFGADEDVIGMRETE